MQLKSTNNTFADDHARDTPALWGGIECSITRVKSQYTDQLTLSGHYDRPEDIDLISDLGISAIRFPILYEKHLPVNGQPIDWSWAEDRLQRLKEKNITVIAGLVHHGSGPAYTNLLSEGFATGLAAYAGMVARQFPHIEFYTPVNEPLTTARFSGLYGTWYPHHANDRSFCRMLINELMAVVLSMKAIRNVNPNAKLIQTEDLGKTYAVSNLQYQANFENERRWISFDFLCGRVDADHPLWQYFVDNGIKIKELQFFLDNPCPPDILGLNYYVTSERFLDDNLSAYPQHMHGGNHLERYVDTESVRTLHNDSSGLRILLEEVYDRYSLPLAMTEVHLHCTREEQMRWFREIWEICCSARQDGINMQAVTAWSLFGAFGWNKLLTSPECDYEPGVFDLRSSQPRETALANLIRSYTRHIAFDHPVLEQPGWWKRDTRLFQHFTGDRAINDDVEERSSGILIVGNGMLADAVVRICKIRAIPQIRLSVDEVATFNTNLFGQLKFSNTWAIVFAEEDVIDSNHTCEVLAQLATYCRQQNRQLLFFSANNKTNEPATEEEVQMSREEKIVFDCHSSSLVIRYGLLFGPWDEESFAYSLIELLHEGRRVKASENTFVTFSYLPDLVNSALDLLIDAETGICHLAHPEKISLFDFAGELCKHSGFSLDMVAPSNKRLPQAPTLTAKRFMMMPSIYCAIEHFAKYGSNISAIRERLTLNLK